jgi:hypothetical protein
MAITLPTARRADIGVSRRMKVGFSPHPLEPELFSLNITRPGGAGVSGDRLTLFPDFFFLY